MDDYHYAALYRTTARERDRLQAEVDALKAELAEAICERDVLRTAVLDNALAEAPTREQADVMIRVEQDPTAQVVVGATSFGRISVCFLPEHADRAMRALAAAKQVDSAETTGTDWNGTCDRQVMRDPIEPDSRRGLDARLAELERLVKSMMRDRDTQTRAGAGANGA